MIIYYVGLRLSPESDLNLRYHLKHNKASQDLHCTLAYSKVWFPYKSIGSWYQPLNDWKIEIFGTNKVLTFSCWSLESRAATFRDVGATWDFPVFVPHITVGEDWERIEIPQFKITLEREYYQTWVER